MQQRSFQRAESKIHDMPGFLQTDAAAVGCAIAAYVSPFGRWWCGRGLFGGGTAAWCVTDISGPSRSTTGLPDAGACLPMRGPQARRRLDVQAACRARGHLVDK